MIEQTRDIPTAAGQTDTLLCYPERGGPSPAVCVLMEAHGIREERRHMAHRLATVGDDVLLPNLDDRAGQDTIFGAGVMEEGSPEHTRMRAVRTKMTIPPVMRDIAAVLACVDRQDAVTLGPVGCPWLLYERPVRVGGGAPLPRPPRRRRFVVRDVARQRGGGEPTSKSSMTTFVHRFRRGRYERSSSPCTILAAPSKRAHE
jgi:carboxymethylenebutenolidase